MIDDFSVSTVEPVKIDSDAFYDAITVRSYDEIAVTLMHKSKIAELETRRKND